MKTSLGGTQLQAVMQSLATANGDLAQSFPGDSTRRQPVHTVYGGAHLFKAETVQRLSELARRAFALYAPDPRTFAKALGMFEGGGGGGDTLRLAVDEREKIAELVHARVAAKLAHEAVEDFRLDFEDGFGSRGDSEEDAVAVKAARELAAGMQRRLLSPFSGLRIKALGEDTKRRSLRTLDIFLTSLVEASGGALPENFVVTLPKVNCVAHVEALVEALTLLERALGLAAGQLRCEIMVETPQVLFDGSGKLVLPTMVKAGKGRVVGAHFGAYDYTASCGIVAAQQTMDHPACDFARHIMKISLAGTTVRLADGATAVMPIGPHRGEGLSEAQQAENRATVHRAWAVMYRNVRQSLRHGFYQGWDLHPAQIPARYGACYAFFLEGLEAASARLTHFVEQAAQASLLGDVFDDAATGQGLLNYFLQAQSCGALSAEQAAAQSGLSLAELSSRSFLKILEGRKGHAAEKTP